MYQTTVTNKTLHRCMGCHSKVKIVHKPERCQITVLLSVHSHKHRYCTGEVTEACDHAFSQLLYFVTHICILLN